MILNWDIKKKESWVIKPWLKKFENSCSKLSATLIRKTNTLLARPRFIKLRFLPFLHARSFSPRCRVSRLTRYFISHVVETVGRVLSCKRFRRNRWQSKLEPYRSSTPPSSRPVRNYVKVWVCKLVLRTYCGFRELMRWKVNIHFFFFIVFLFLEFSFRASELRTNLIFIV